MAMARLLLLLLTAAAEDSCVERSQSHQLLQTAQERHTLLPRQSNIQLHEALQRRSNRSDRSNHSLVTLESSLSKKGLVDVFDDAFDAVSDAANIAVDYARDIGGGLVDIGLSVGSFTANAAVVIGHSVVKVAEQTYAAVPAAIKEAANSLGSAVVHTVKSVKQAAQSVAKVTSKLARGALSAAKKSIAEGVKLATEVGNTVASAATEVAEGAADLAEKMGPMVVKMAKATWTAIKDFVGCFFSSRTSLCKLFVNDICDCDAGSDIDVDFTGGGIKVDCIFKVGGFALVSDAGEMETTKLPGRFEGRPNMGLNVKLKGKKQLGSKKARAPRGSCSGKLEIAMDGAVQFDPRVKIEVNVMGETTVEIAGMIRASADALVEGEGSCAFKGERGFPDKPKTKVFCAGKVCVIILLQMMAELEVAGTLTGSAEMSASADFSISSRIQLDVKGGASVKVKSPEINHESGFGLAASASAVLRLGFGPILTVWPMPGVPVSVNPMMNAELRGQATMAFSAASLLQRDNAISTSERSLESSHNGTMLTMISQEVVSAAGGRECTIFPNWRLKWLGDHVSMGLGGHPYCSSVASWQACLDLCKADTACHQVVYVNNHCCGMKESSDEDQDALGGENFDYTSAQCYMKVNKIDMCAAAALNLYTDVEVQAFALPKSMRVALSTDWIGEVLSDAIISGAKAMTNFLFGSITQCGPWSSALDKLLDYAAEQAAKYMRALIPSWGIDFSTPSQQLLAPKKLFCLEVMTTPGFSTAPCAAQLGCSHAGRGTPQTKLQEKENEAKDDESESTGTSLLQGTDGPTEAVPVPPRCTVRKHWRLALVAGSEMALRPAFPYGSVTGNWEDCLYLCSRNQDCRQVVYGHGRCYATKLMHYADVDNLGGQNMDWTFATCSGQVSETAIYAARTCDTSVGWRFNYTPGSEIPLGSMAYGSAVESWSTCVNLCSRTEACAQVVFNSISKSCWAMNKQALEDQDGLGGNNTDWISAHCFGEMCPTLPMGYLFIDIGPWRLAAWDDNHLSLANRVGGKAIVFRNDGVILEQRADLLAFERPIEAPFHVLFGFQFIQIGQFRLGAVNDNCFSIVHSNGNTIQAFWSDGTTSKPMKDSSTDLWDRPQSRSNGIDFGERFLQFGRFRLALQDNSETSPLVLSHNQISSQYWRSDGTSHGANSIADPTDWSHKWTGPLVALPPAHWECQSVDELAFGACSNFGGFGDRFIELGKWRLAAIDATHFSISHQDGQTPQIFRSDGVMLSGRTDYSAWDRPKGFPSGITFGSAFIQIGNFRLGDGDGRHFTLAHKTGEHLRVIQCFRSDGTLWGEKGSPWPMWDRTSGPATGVIFGDRFLQIGQWRLGSINDDTFLVEHSSGNTVQAYYSWNAIQTGGASGYAATLYKLRYSEFHCGPVQNVFGSCVGITLGKKFIQLGDWRLGDWDGTFAISHKDGATVRYYSSAGDAFHGPTGHFNSWWAEAKYEAESEVVIGDRFIQFGFWRLGANDTTLTLSHSGCLPPAVPGPGPGGKTAMLWRSTGYATAGPSTESAKEVWGRPVSPGGLSFGDRFMQLGKFRIGDVDGRHLAISYEGTVVELLRHDSWIGPGPRYDLTTFGRPMEECSIV